jgi:hypothetical protein
MLRIDKDKEIKYPHYTANNNPNAPYCEGCSCLSDDSTDMCVKCPEWQCSGRYEACLWCKRKYNTEVCIKGKYCSGRIPF